MTMDHDPQEEIDVAPGLENAVTDNPLKSISIYFIGFILSAILTIASFYTVGSKWIWTPGIPVALTVLAVAQIGVHLTFFLHLTTGRDNVNNSLALAFGTLVVGLVIGGTFWIMSNMNQHMPQMAHMTSSTTDEKRIDNSEVSTANVAITSAPATPGRILTVSCEVGASVQKGQICATIETSENNAPQAQRLKNLQHLIQEEASLLDSTMDEIRHLGAKSVRRAQLQKQAQGYSAKLTNSRTQALKLTAQIEKLKDNGCIKKIVAPIDGIVTSKNIEPGQLIEAGFNRPLFTFNPRQ